jgi:hypothetical protein
LLERTIRRSAKRGEPQIFPLYVTLWASGADVLAVSCAWDDVAFPSRKGAKQIEHGTWPRCESIGAFLFRWMPKFSRTKAVAHAAFFHCRAGASPFLEQKRGTNVKEAAITAAFTASSTPNDRCPRKRHVWGTRQRRWFLTWPAPLLCLTRLFCARGHIAKNRNAVFNSAFLCSRSHREKSKCSQIAMRLTSKAGDLPPYGQQDANFGLDPLEGWGPFLHGGF